MPARVHCLVIVLCVCFFANAQMPGPGVSQPLAIQRAAYISRLRYQLTFNIPPEKAAPIKASALITFRLRNNNQPLQLDFRQDSSHVQTVTVNGRATPVQLQHEHLVIDKNWLKKDSNTIQIEFIAGNESLNRNNEYMYALFVPDRARTVFPCFDQPDLKAVFVLSLKTPAGWAAMANAPLKDSIVTEGGITYHFKPSDKLPTYLFSFTAGKYTDACSGGMQFLFRESDTAKLRLSIDSVFRLHREAVSFLEDWTGIPFPFQKCGFVGIPAFQFGGMEHPGEVQYNAPALFLDKGATKDQLIARSALIAHETAHMWFGDMVTMQWFNDVWMKEVFANFMADKLTEKLLGTETFQLKFLLDHTPAAFGVDRTPGANAIRQHLDNLKDAGSMYGNIIYHKAPIMMRQLEMLMGKPAFQKGVQEYLRTYRYGNARWNDLITMLGKYTKADLQTWNQVWVYRPGRPVFDYDIKGGQLIITQAPERGPDAVWPQQFSVVAFYPDSSSTIHITMNSTSVSVPLATKPISLLFNADGTGYGLFPGSINDHIHQLTNPLQRAAAYINAYENMLANRGIKADQLLDFFITGLSKETNELNLRTICGYTGNVYWNFSTPAQRAAKNRILEEALRTAIAQQSSTNNKKLLFKTLQEVYESSTAASYFYNIWRTQKAPDSIKLTEDDYTSIAISIALKSDTAGTLLQEQLERITDPDRKARLRFLVPSLSADSTVRDDFFRSLSDISNRRKEPWVAAALSYLNHPLRQKTFIKFLPASLNMLEEIQRTGDIFFPQNWLSAIFSNYQSAEAWQIADGFLNNHPGYNPLLKAKILQTTDNLHRANAHQHGN